MTVTIMGDQLITNEPRRRLMSAPTDGPLAVESVEPLGDPTVSLGGDTEIMAPSTPPPAILPTAPSPPSQFLLPATYRNPNHYEFGPNNGGRDLPPPFARPGGEGQLVYTPRQDWRRPSYVEQEPITP